VPADEQRAIELVAMATAHVGLPTKPRDDHAHDAKDTMAYPHPVLLLTVVAVVVVVLAAAVLLVQLPMRQVRPDTAEERRARHLKKCRFRSSFGDATLRLHPHSLQASRQDLVNRRSSSSSIRVASRLQTLQLHLLLRMASAAIDVGAPRSSAQARRGMTRQRQLSQTRLDAVLSSLAYLGRRALARRP
jgi:uncharacterized membrane protein